MKVNINDIEDIIIAKIEIDKDNPNINGRSQLNEFINEYCQINWILLYNDMSIPFEIKTIFDKKYVFFSTNSPEEKNILNEFLSLIKENIFNMKKISSKDMIEKGLQENTLYVIMDKNYYTL